MRTPRTGTRTRQEGTRARPSLETTDRHKNHGLEKKDPRGETAICGAQCPGRAAPQRGDRTIRNSESEPSS